MCDIVDSGYNGAVGAVSMDGLGLIATTYNSYKPKKEKSKKVKIMDKYLKDSRRAKSKK